LCLFLSPLVQASWAGRRFGRTRWPGTAKSIEGTACAIAAVMLCFLALAAPPFYFHSQAVVRFVLYAFGLLLVAVVVMALEAVTLQVDNLTLPPVAYALACAVAVLTLR
jgi:dolichol kinase